MEVSHDEGVANHIGPESCGDGSNSMAEALTGDVRAEYRAVKCLYSRVLTIWVTRKATPEMSLERDIAGPCAVVDLGTYGSSLHGNREILCLPSGEGSKAASRSPRT